MDIKEQLIKAIEEIDDQIILVQLSALLKESDQSYKAEFSKSQKALIENSQKQVKEGNFYSNDTVLKMLKNESVVKNDER